MNTKKSKNENKLNKNPFMIKKINITIYDQNFSNKIFLKYLPHADQSIYDIIRNLLIQYRPEDLVTCPWWQYKIKLLFLGKEISHSTIFKTLLQMIQAKNKKNAMTDEVKIYVTLPDDCIIKNQKIHDNLIKTTHISNTSNDKTKDKILLNDLTSTLINLHGQLDSVSIIALTELKKIITDYISDLIHVLCVYELSQSHQFSKESKLTQKTPIIKMFIKKNCSFLELRDRYSFLTTTINKIINGIKNYEQGIKHFKRFMPLDENKVWSSCVKKIDKNIKHKLHSYVSTLQEILMHRIALQDLHLITIENSLTCIQYKQRAVIPTDKSTGVSFANDVYYLFKETSSTIMISSSNYIINIEFLKHNTNYAQWSENSPLWKQYMNNLNYFKNTVNSSATVVGAVYILAPEGLLHFKSQKNVTKYPDTDAKNLNPYSNHWIKYYNVGHVESLWIILYQEDNHTIKATPLNKFKDHYIMKRSINTLIDDIKYIINTNIQYENEYISLHCSGVIITIVMNMFPNVTHNMKQTRYFNIKRKENQLINPNNFFGQHNGESKSSLNNDITFDDNDTFDDTANMSQPYNHTNIFSNIQENDKGPRKVMLDSMDNELTDEYINRFNPFVNRTSM